ncbi:LysR family transcriptional regulator [Massilia forsythiae]|uniref:HTH-type transcriptional regulator MetR n=1 Tax=Massilia forsythiae TaxID=2728020 RepID=A0A7Z2VZ58_9BURK|nr:LysR family transcriptional regulator [Massilia forsythiae]QJE01582.1 LysR family transcriptional regulator [Massilia forsythiae]
MLERSHLEILVEVKRHGSVTAAAEALHLTQSALSHNIRKLEQQAGTDIWLREGRALRLTQAGEYLLAVAQRLLPQMELAEQQLAHFAQGERGTLRIGMECHPCYQWLLKVVAPYLAAWPLVDVDVKQKFQFGGVKALLGHEIDLLVTPDPMLHPGLRFEPVFGYEQVLVVHEAHPWAGQEAVRPEQLAEETLITYPVPIDRLDIYNTFLLPANCRPRKHKTIETTDIMLQMVAGGRGVTALPKWLVTDYAPHLRLRTLRLGPQGIRKHIHLGAREADWNTDYLHAFVALARQTGQ